MAEEEFLLAPICKVTAVLVSALFLANCSSQTMTLPADIEPVYKIRNSPIPVPDPKWKPQRRSAVAAPKQRQIRHAQPKAVPLPSKRVSHKVKKGETLYALSRRFGVPVRAMIAANRLRSPYTIAVGQQLRVPYARVHIVEKGETGYSISRRYSVTTSDLMQANAIRPPYRLAVGQRLKLPGGALAEPAVTASGSVPVKSGRRPSRRAVAIPAPPRSAGGFEWPIAGKIASRFGPREGGMHNDGINILASKGAPVKAADAGTVVYASNALEGYGNLLLVKHASGWITAYAHNERILVRPGQVVKRGEIVARVGSTGGVTAPQLHFEIRKGRQALDPLRYLAGSPRLKS